MALLWIEGFEGFGASGANPTPTGVVGRKYTVVDETGMYVNPGRTGGLSMLLNDKDVQLGSGNLTTDSTLIIGFAFQVTALPSDTRGNVVTLYDGATLGMRINVQTVTGRLQIFRGATLLATSIRAIITNRWYYLEFKVVCSDTGSYELRIDSETWLVDTGPVDTKEGTNNYHTSFMLRSGYGFPLYTSFDDLYVLDGTAGLSTFLGPQRVVALNSDGDDTITWDRSTGATNYEVVDDGDTVDNTDYVYTATLPEQDLYDYEPVSTGVVNGIQIMTETNMDEGSCDLAAVVKSAATESIGTANSVVVGSDVTHVRVVEDDPNAAAPWTQTTLNAAKFGIKATA